MVEGVGRMANKMNPETIAAMVEARVDLMTALRDRQDEDLARFRLEPYDSNDDETTEYESYTSNEPATYADKMMSLLSTGRMVPRVPHVNAKEGARRKYDLKERLVRGFYEAGNEKLVATLQPVLLDQLSFYVTLFGWYATRAMLVNVEAVNGVETTEVDIQPFDPRQVYWGMGPTGLEWVCVRSHMTPDEIYADWGVEVDGDNESSQVVYDYYSKTHNTVTTAMDVIKKPTEHGYWKVPVAIGMAGLSPFLRSENESEGDWSHYGEGLYKSNRNVYDQKNTVLSIYLELLKKSRDPSWLFSNRGGKGELAEDPNEPGQVHSIDTDDKLQQVEIPEITRTVEQFLAVISGEGQRGSVPYSVYGELAFQLSGFAINSLNTTMQTTLHPFQSAIERGYDQIANMLVDQYTSRNFESMNLSGFSQGGEFFEERIELEEVMDLPPVQHKLTANIPQDQAGKFALAQTAVQFMALPEILEEILEVDDVDATMDAYKRQLAEQGDDIAAAYSMMIAAERRDDQNLAAIWWSKIQQLMLERMQTGAPPIQHPGQSSKPGQLDPRILSQPSQNGGQPPAPTPQAGGFNPPGQERPGAQGGFIQKALGAIGIGNNR